MRQRMSFTELPPGFSSALFAVGTYLGQGPLDGALQSLVKVRVSQINQCAFCIDMHSREALEAGCDARRLRLVAAWREAPGFDGAERAALGLAEALTRLDGPDLIESSWVEAAAHFDRHALADLCMAIAEINAWNRISRACGFDLPRAG